MKTTISKENILKSSILFLTFSAFILTVLVFTSCSETAEVVTDDATLIERIETAAKEVVSVNDLPSSVANLSGDLSDSFIQDAVLAPNLGYKVAIFTDNEERSEDKAEVFFSLEGRQLNDQRDNARRRRHRCFTFVFPIDFIMPDDSSITLESADDWVLIRQWYDANPDEDERPDLVFPLDITLADGTAQTVLDRDELKAVKRACKEDRSQRKCFKLVLPVTYTMPDATEITVTERSEWRLIRRWYKANPDATERGILNYPVEIEYKDGSIVAIADATELQTAKDDCSD